MGFSQGMGYDTLGNLYIADTNNNALLKLTPGGQLTLFAGTGVAGYDGDFGPAASGRLNAPAGVAIDASNNVFIADTNNNRIRRVDAVTGIVTTFAGLGFSTFSGDGGPAAVDLFRPRGMAFDRNGNLDIADTSNNRIRQISPAGIVSTVAGTAWQIRRRRRRGHRGPTQRPAGRRSRQSRQSLRRRYR